MGVFGLWDILLTTAQKISVQNLSGKILAIDASIWLVKADSIFAEDSQKIKCILQKIVYLRKNNILPIFVFDGIPPAIKRKTLEKRKQKIRQGSEIDVRKKTQIAIMHLLQNSKNQKNDNQSSKNRKFVEKQQQMKQIDKLLSNLSQIQVEKQKMVTDQDINKIRLQSQVLTYKYQLMKEDPRLEGLECFQLEQFEEIGIEQKLQYLHLMQGELYSRQSRKNKISTIKQLSKLTPEQKILYQMQKIYKKTKLRQLQDELYRKTLQNNIKVQDGFEIIEEIRNGKKYVMKRKINSQNNSKSIWQGKGKKQKNDFSTILNYNKDKSSKQQTQLQKDDPMDMYGNEPDPFLMDLIGKDMTKNKKVQQSKSVSLNFHQKINSKQRKLQLNSQQDKKQSKQKVNRNNNNNKQQKLDDYKIQKDKNSTNLDKKPTIKSVTLEKVYINDSSIKNALSHINQKVNNASESQFEQSEEYNLIIGKQINGKKQRYQSQQQQSHEENEKIQQKDEDKNSDNLDNLPRFINFQNLSIRHLDTENHRNIEFQKLLDMIGIPYAKATSEAEAQCAQLERNQFVDGIITEDSDVFLFGARNVFRGVFNDNIKYFSTNKIVEKLKLNREKLIIFSMLLGSDYSDGIKGIGIVNAMQILKIFDNFDKLQQFKKWARYADILHSNESNTTQNILKQLSNEEEKQFYEFHKRFKNYWYIEDDFPKDSVIQAYLKPDVIDKARMKQMKQTKYFQLKQFNEQAVRIFMRERLLLTYSQTQAYCKCLKNSFKRQVQTKLTDFFVGQNHEFAKIRSKRLMKALGQEQNFQQNNQKKQKNQKKG